MLTLRGSGGPQRPKSRSGSLRYDHTDQRMRRCRKQRRSLTSAASALVKMRRSYFEAREQERGVTASTQIDCASVLEGQVSQVIVLAPSYVSTGRPHGAIRAVPPSHVGGAFSGTLLLITFARVRVEAVWSCDCPRGHLQMERRLPFEHPAGKNLSSTFAVVWRLWRRLSTRARR